MITIKEVQSRKDLKAFITFPFQLYSKSSNWIPPLIGDELKTLDAKINPAFDHCEARYWLAYKNGKVVGRIAGIINNAFIEKWKERKCRFGWIDFIDDLEVSKALITEVENWAIKRNLTEVHGPLGFTDMDEEGMLVEGFEELGTLATIYNHPYYPTHLEAHGYAKDTDWIEYELQVPTELPERLLRINEQVLKRNNLEMFVAKNKKEILPFAPQVFEILNEAYSHLYGFVPLTEKQIANYIDQYFGFINPDFVPMVIDENKRVVGFGIGMPSLSNGMRKARGKLFPFGFVHILKALKSEKTLDLYLVAIKPEYQKKGINSVLMTQMNRAAIKYGMTKAETNVELEDNHAVQSMWKAYESRQHKRRRVFVKSV